MNLAWLPYLVAMLRSPELRGYLRDLYKLTSGSVSKSRATVGRMRDQGIVLKSAEDDIDRRLMEIDQQNEGKP